MAEDMDVDLRSMLDVQREIDGVQREIDGVQRKIDDVEFQLSIAKDPEEKKYLRDEEKYLRDEKKYLREKEKYLREKEKQLRDEKMQLRALQLEKEKQRTLAKGAHSGPSSVWDEKSMVESLLNIFQTAAVDARSKQVIALQKDLGQQFKIAGRDTTYEVLLKGTAAMFKRFVSPLSEFQEYQREQPFYFAMVAFPGAGKTTLGTRAWPFLKERWESLGSGEERRSLLSMLSQEEFDRFEAMCTTSLQYNLCMYHLVATANGGVLKKEEGLLPPQILALRCLAAVLDIRDYNQFFDRLDSECSGMKHHITLCVVLKFLWWALGMEKGDELLVPFFFDEVNQVTRHLDGREVTGGGALPTWFQEMMSAYVQEEHQLALHFDKRIEKVFPVLSVASTRFSVTSLRFTASAKCTGLSVPFQPLTSQECEGVVLDLLGRWADTLEIPKCTSIPDSTQFIIDVSGGMPRALSRGLEALCGTTKLDECFKRCSTEMGSHELVRVVQLWEHTLATTYFSAYYGDPNKAHVLCRVLALSVLRKPVRRNISVLDSGSYRHITYGDMEDSGLVALTPASELQYARGQSDIGASEVLVKCSPFLVWSLLKCLEGIPTPSFTRTSSRDKEADDLMSVLLRIYLLERAFGHQEFSLNEILPPGAYIPQSLQDRKFSLQCNNYGIFEHHHKLRDRAGFTKMREEARRIKGEEYCAFLACGNEAGDSYIVLKDTLVAGEEVVLVIQSKTTSSDTFQGLSTLVDNLERDVGWFQKVHIPRTLIQELKGKCEKATPWEMKLRGRKRSHYGEFLTGSQYDTKMAEVCEPDLEECGGMDTVNFVYAFMSNRPVSSTFKLAVQAAQEVVPWFDRVVLAYECEARDHGDALSVLTSIRRWKDLF